MARTGLLIPACNEEPVIGQTLRTIPPGLFDRIVVVNNASADRTAEVAAANGAEVVPAPERGYGAACLAGIGALGSDVDVIVFLQADGSEDPAEAKSLIEPIVRGEADLAIGSRTLGRAERGALLPHQAAGNRVATGLIRLLYGRRFSDIGAFRAIRRTSLEQLGMRDQTYGWTVEMQVKALRKGLRVIEVPVSYRVRAAGKPKISGNWINSIRAGLAILWMVYRAAR